MGNVLIKLDDAGIQELLKSTEIMAELKKHGKTVLGNAGDGYAMDEHIGKTRGNVSIYANSKEAYQDNLNNNTLLKAVSK